MKKNTTSKFISIAYDIADRINKGNIKENEKLRGRSVLASRYNVSPETIRKSMILLSDMNIVTIIDKSGIFVKSKLNAEVFLQKYQARKNLLDFKKEIRTKIEEKQKIDRDILDIISDIETISYPESTFNMFSTQSFTVKEGSRLINNSATKIKLWKQTGATIIAVSRNNELIVSPGQDFEFNKDDLVYYIGKDYTKEKLVEIY